MEHIPTQESDIEKVYRIARELGIGIEEAAITCDAFHLAFSDEGLRRSIFGMIDELDESAVKKGEPLGLIIRYTVELGMDGIRVGRYADEIPAGEIVSLTPTDRAVIFLKIKDNFPTQQFLGPVIVNRPEMEPVPGAAAFSTGQSCWPEPTGDFSAISKIQNTKSNCEVVCSDRETKKPAIPLGPSSLEPARIVICLGPIRLTFNERFPFMSGAMSQNKPGSFLNLPAYNAPQHLPPWVALQVGTPAFQSGLSPPRPSENLGHSDAKDVPPALAIDFRDTRLKSGSLKINGR